MIDRPSLAGKAGGGSGGRGVCSLGEIFFSSEESTLRVEAVDSAPILFKLQFCFTSVHMCLVHSDFLP